MKVYKKRQREDENIEKRKMINKKFKEGMECFEGYEYIDHLGSGSFGTLDLYKDLNDIFYLFPLFFHITHVTNQFAPIIIESISTIIGMIRDFALYTNIFSVHFALVKICCQC